MVSIFTKKIYLIDLLQGFIDIHNHILPGIDDGAQTVDDSIALIKEFSDFGVNDFIATPHIMHNYYDNSPISINNALQILKDDLNLHGLRASKIQASAEHMIDDNFETILERNEIMPLSNEHLLVEMSYLQRPINFDKSIIAITRNRFFPVLAHPERYNFLHGRKHKYGEFKQQGILFQLNMLSLGEFYGREVQKMALRLLDQEMIDFLGSDVHNLNQLSSLKKLTINKKMKKLLVPIIENTKEIFK